jgi:hypothetical protein
MISYIISGSCVICGAYLACSSISAWPWFLAAGTIMFFVAAGAEMNEKDEKEEKD